MRRLVVCLFTLVTLLFVSAAFATNARSAVSVAGNDANPCTVALPCRSFSVALTNTAAGGEIVALDSAGYGPFTINQSVTVSGAPGVHAAISVSSGDAIVIQGGTVTLRNLVFIGSGSASDAVNFEVGTKLHVSNCYIRGFANRGIDSEWPGTLTFIDHTTVEDSGIAFGVDDTTAWISDSTAIKCNVGIRSYASSGGFGSSVTAVNTNIVHSNTAGVDLVGFGSGNLAFVALDRCSIVQSGITLGSGSGGSTVLVLTGNTIDAISASGSYLIDSFGNNAISYTGGATLTAVPLH